MEYIGYYDSPLGQMTLSSDGEHLTRLFFAFQKHLPSLSGEYNASLPVFAETVSWLEIYFGGREPGFMPSLSLRGTAFQKEVWDILLTIPYGKTMTYGEIAGIIGKRRECRMSAQAVGQAVGLNPVSIIVPCHRVMGKDGNLTGYAGGIERKIRLLGMENIDTSSFHAPRGRS